MARALNSARQVSLLVLDEATAALPGPEAERLFGALRRVTAAGTSVIFISHYLDEILEITDRVTVLRDGRNVAVQATSRLGHDELVELMLGRTLRAVDHPPVRAGPDGAQPRLQVRGLSGGTLGSLDLDVAAGEIIGIAGVTGSGREQLADLLSGRTPGQHGQVRIDGCPCRRGDPRDAIAAGLASIPADRHRQALLLAGTARENLTLGNLRGLRRWGAQSRSRERAEARRWMMEVQVRPPDTERLAAQFSGGNQQKLVIARCLRMDASVLVFDEPTQGIDVAAKVAIHQLIAAAARRGAAVIVCSSDADELASIASRVVVLRRGRIGSVLTGDAMTAEHIEQAQLRGSTAGVSPGTSGDRNRQDIGE
jgi:ribose transport system ATP-binding protein